MSESDDDTPRDIVTHVKEPRPWRKLANRVMVDRTELAALRALAFQ